MFHVNVGASISSLAKRRVTPQLVYRSVAYLPSLRRQYNVTQEAADDSKEEIPFRKQYKEERKRRRIAEAPQPSPPQVSEALLARWELTVGLEIHAQLNADQKLFSRASTTSSDNANVNATLFDLALPGSQPVFNQSVLLPALRAALALQCRISHESRFDRKHYFYQDQPAGYQITQYYEPFARDGFLILNALDDISPEQGANVRIGIKQIQLEQDTAKTVQQPPNVMLLDFNRVGHPLIEIITLPHIHDPKTAAACVKKIQGLLASVNAVTTGMELGGLRVDVNVSVRPKDSQDGIHSYYGVTGLGQRTEIKNLSSFKAVEEAVTAERNRQIGVLEAGGQIHGETRGWSLGGTETRKLRGKEGEVDYRYMPDPDVPPLRIHKDLVDHVRAYLPISPEQQVSHLLDDYGLTIKDAKIMVFLDGGLRLDYLKMVLEKMTKDPKRRNSFGLLVSNWILHEIGGFLSTTNTPFDTNPIQAASLASLLLHLDAKQITTNSAKTVLARLFEGDQRNVEDIIAQDELSVRHVDAEGLNVAAKELVEKHPDMALKVLQGQKGKFQWFVGQLIKQNQGRLDAKKAAAALEPLLSPK